ncbi:LOW QUALITY PROTEIN: protein SCAR3-like [Primulina tabacum]|uniref:LOW QUALITY PROTEIN: protein SCAR3-like n=1 Tax=Primulina tabacum TaxID=48773 RepID=UPI003F5A0E6F
MPLVRLEVRSEYALGAPELYRQVNKEDPKEILEGIAVSGLVGVLRQLGDLAEFAADLFHGLQDDVMRTSSRNHKLMARVQHIESALAPLEKAVLAQRSHLHFAYTAGSNWHAHIQCEENHFSCSDVPQFIMDSYEGSRGCPHLHLLDRFDPCGPGSCLKRYSDPTLFKKASVASGEASTENISKNKLSRKVKKLKQKRRSNPRIREVSRGASFFYHGGRTQFTQLNAGGNSTSQLTCSSEDVLRSDIGEQSNLDLRNGCGYIESEFCSSYSIQSMSSPAKRHSLEQKATDIYDGIQISPSRNQPNYSNSSYVTWDEKTDAVESTAWEYDISGTTQEFDPDRNTVSRSSKLNFETWGVDELSMEIIGKNDDMPCDEALPTLESGDILVEDIDSEADQFMDALNTIESECETDTNCTKKIEGCYSEDDKVADDRVDDLISSNLEYQSLKSESNVLADSPTITVSFEQDPILGSPQSPSTAFSSINGGIVKTELTDGKETRESVERGGLQKVDPPEKVDIDYGAIEGCVSNTVLSGCRDDISSLPIIDRARSSPESQTPAPETSNVSSVMFWTNGSLLGLKPSKPPDYSLENALPQDPLSKNDEKTRKISCEISPADSSTRHGNTGNSIYQTINSSIVTSTAASRSLLPGNLEYQASRSQQDNSTSSSRIFELSNRLFTLGAKGKLLHDQNESPASYPTTGAFEQKNNQKVAHQTFSGPSKDLIGSKPPVLSPSASPPLEHMKISFQPIDGFETSKLKLKFPDRYCNNESSRCVFPSFQLVPEVSGTLRNDVSDSDDDTFYRSSPSLETDRISQRSESNSDRWESGGSPCSKDHDFYDSFHQISLTESVSTVTAAGRKNHGDNLENCKLQCPFVENGVQNSRSQHSFDLHSSDTQICSFMEELAKNTNSQHPLVSQFMVTPATPPLPSEQWRGMKPNQKAMDNNSEALPKASKYAFDLKLSGSTVSQQPKPAPLNQNHTFENSDVQNSKQSGLHDPDAKQKDNRQTGGVDKKEDFLHQIRTRAFSLRPTTTTKPFAQSVGHTNVEVTAILKKANAVRQAVGSDDDGTWSDP